VPYPRAYALGPDGDTVAIGGEDGAVRLLDLGSGAARPVAGRHGGPVTAVRFSPDGRTLVSAGEDRAVLVWDVASRALAETLTGHANGISDLAVTADGRTLYTGGLDGRILIWDLHGGRRLGRPVTLGAGDEERPQLALSTDGRLIATGQDDGAISVVDARTLAHRGTFPVVDTGQVLGIGFVPGGRRMVVGGPEGFLAVVDVDAERVVRRLRGHAGAIFTPGISADGRLLATASDDGTVRLWSLPDGRPLGRPLRFPGRGVQDAQLSPDGRWLTVVTVDDTIERGTVEVWDARRRRRVHSRRVPGFPGTARFSPDGRRLAVGFRSGRTQLWSTTTWRRDARDLVGAASGIIGMAFTADGGTIVTGSDTGIVRLWDARTGAALSAPLPGEPSRLAVPYFTRDGTRLIASYDTGRAVLWDIRPASLVRQACAVAGRRLTRAEWAEYLPGRPYDPAC
jgi:WD40 repeat protein